MKCAALVLGTVVVSACYEHAQSHSRDADPRADGSAAGGGDATSYCVTDATVAVHICLASRPPASLIIPSTALDTGDGSTNPTVLAIFLHSTTSLGGTNVSPPAR